MSVGAENGSKLVAASILGVLALVLLGRSITSLITPSEPESVGAYLEKGVIQSSLKKKATNTSALDPALRIDKLTLAEGIQYEGVGRNIFGLEVPVLKVPRRLTPEAPPLPPHMPSPPTVHLRFFGFVSTPGDSERIFLSNDGDVFIGKQGEIINRRYRIIQITPTYVELEDLIDIVRRKLPLEQG